MNLYILNRNEEVVSVLSDNAGNSACHFFNAVMTKELNKGASLTFTVDVGELGEEAQHITEENLVVVPDNDEFRLFVIKESTDTHEGDLTKEVYCECSSIELADEVVLKDIVGKHEVKYVLSQLLEGTRWEVGNIKDSHIRTLTGEYTGESVLSGITTLVSEYEMEYDFSVEFVGNRITKRLVHIQKTFGRTLGKRFEYNKDITTIKRTVNTGDIKTAIIPYGKLIEATTEDTTRATREVIEGKRITIEGIEWVTPENPLNKPLGQLYLENPEATKQWGCVNPDGSYRPKWIVMNFDECETPEELIAYANMQLARYTSPKISYEVSVEDLYLLTGDKDYSFETVKLGDLVNIIDHSFHPALTVSSRVVLIEHNLNFPDQTKLTLGTVVPTIVDKDLQTQLNELNYKVSSSASSSDLSGVIERIEGVENNLSSGRWETLNELNNLLFGESIGYHYIEKENGVWVYDRPKDQNPTKAVVLKGGMVGLAKWDEQLQTWNVGTFIDGDSVNASMITTGTLSADVIEGGSLDIRHFSKAYLEDLEEQLSTLTVTEDKIHQIVSESFVSLDEFGEATGDIQTRLASLETTADGIEMNFQDILKGYATSTELEEYASHIDTYIRFSTSGIELGESASDFKTIITNEKISFKQGGEEVAYISNNKLFITNGEIVEQLILGGFEIAPRDSGNLSFSWKG